MLSLEIVARFDINLPNAKSRLKGVPCFFYRYQKFLSCLVQRKSQLCGMQMVHVQLMRTDVEGGYIDLTMVGEGKA